MIKKCGTRRVILLPLYLLLLLTLSTLAACGSQESTGQTGNKVTESQNGSDNTTNGEEAADEEIRELTARLAHTYPVEEPVHKGAELFAQLVAEKSGGKIKIDVFPQGQLYNDHEMPEALTTGQIEMGFNTMDIWAGNVPAAEFSALPLFSSFDQVHWALENGIAEVITAELNQVGAHPLIWADYGFGYFASREVPLDTVDNMKGKKVRTVGPLQSKLVELAGGTPVTLPGLEVIPALQRGTIDAGLSGVTAFVALQYYQYTDYYTGPFNVGLVPASTSMQWWNTLNEAEKTLITEAAQEAQAWIAEEVQKQQSEAMEKLAAEGMEFVDLQRDSYEEVFDQIIDQYLERSGEVGQKIIKSIRSAQENVQ